MTQYKTNNPVGSPSPKDVNDNAIALDHIANPNDNITKDRLGNDRLTIKGLERSGVSAGPTVEAAAIALEQANAAKANSDEILKQTDGYIESAKHAAESSKQSAVDSKDYSDKARGAAIAAESIVDTAGTYPNIA
ncbi:hypothetical protein AB7W11_23605, partial [Providencia manganoxydans]|uniref:hypothetical protein n=1 Tax=Providencia manganoxydans TaxID=2923283 RepID=UPI0034E6E346